MSFDLLSSASRFSRLEVFVEQKFPLTSDQFFTQYGIEPKRAAFFDIPWHEDMVYFMRKEEFSQAASLKGRFPGIFLLTFEDLESHEVSEELTNYIMPVKESSAAVNHMFEMIDGLILERKKVSLLKLAQKQSSALFKEAGAFIGELEKDKEVLDPVIAASLSLDNDLLNEKTLKGFIEKTRQHFSSLDLWHELNLYSLDELVEKENVQEDWSIFPLDWLGLPHFLAYKLNESQGRRSSLGLALFLEWLEKYAAFNMHQNIENESNGLWEEALSQIPLPLALINEHGELVVYNQRFTRLNFSPRECINLANDEAVEIKKEFYKVRRTSLEKKEGTMSLFLFVNNDHLKSEEPTPKNLKSISSQELGIISSSIAHELNNPLAGILAAIALLELEDWQTDELDALEDMKNSARRCKTLVEIFLGFSRTRDKQQRQGTMREALGQALDLLRFRMIESDVRIEVDVETGGEPFKRYVNFSLGSMVLYLVLGEVLTSFNHHRLVLGAKDMKALKTLYKEENDRITLTFPRDFEIAGRMEDSKLIKYLVDVLGLEFEIEHNKVTFLDWKLI